MVTKMFRPVLYVGTALAIGYLVLGLLVWSAQHGQVQEIIWGLWPTPGWVHALLALLLLIGIFSALRFLTSYERRKQEKKEPACQSCGYSLIGNISGTCPECGSEVARAIARRVS